MKKGLTKTLFLLGSVALVMTGCSSGKKVRQDINLLKTQVGGLTSDVSRLSQETRYIQETLKEQEGQGTYAGAKGSAVTQAGVYRTPSGFELRANGLQQALKNAGYYQGSVDGKIGSGTVDAIRRFQADNGLAVDGVCGRKTWSKLQVYADSGIK